MKKTNNINDFDHSCCRQKKAIIKIHDSSQIEARFNFSRCFFHQETKQKKNYNKYNIFIYFFLPKQMEINSSTYKKTQFYEDIRPLVRFREDNLCDHNFRRQNLDTLIKNFHEIRNSFYESKLNISDFFSNIEKFKIFVFKYSSLIKKHIKLNSRELSLFQKSDDRAVDLCKLNKQCQEIQDFLTKVFFLYEELGSLKVDSKNEFSEMLKKEVTIACEFIFYNLRNMIAHLNSCFFNKANYESIAQLKRYCISKTDTLFFISSDKGYYWIIDSSNSLEKDGYLIRYGELKKHVSQVLYLDVANKKPIEYRKQISYMMAAAFAATWAFVANILLIFLFRDNNFDSTQTTDSLLSFGGFTVLLFFVISYVLKDRIKDLGKDKILRKVGSNIPDHRKTIFYKKSDDNKKNLGSYKEYVKFINDRSFLPNEFENFRSNSFSFSNSSTILLYKKSVSLINRFPIFDKYFHAIHDITRFSVRRFLPKLGDPSDGFLSVERSGATKWINLPKLYYIDVVVKCELADSIEKFELSFKRIFINKNGIVSIEERD